jgi:NAD-dependent deacetylase
MKKIAVFTGSGISAESGIQTFRDTVNGLWYNYKVEDVAHKNAWTKKNQARVLEFYNERRSQLANVEPNQAHLDLAKLEQHFEVTIITQNVDDLHERAGSTNVIHLHGELTKVRSTYNPNFIYPWGYKPLNVGDKCIKGSQLRPEVVWFGEELDEELVVSAIEKIHEAEYIIIIGTSLSVYPANKIPFYNNNDEVPIYIIDKEELKDLDDFIKTKNRIHVLRSSEKIGVSSLVKELINKK